MKRTRFKIIGALLVGAFLVATPLAGAVGESARGEFAVVSLKKKFSPSSFQPSSLQWGVQVSPAEGAITILPMRVADMRFPSNRVMRFQPARHIKPCRENSTLLVGPAPVVYARCPDSVIGNGEATFQLGQSVSPLAFRKGTVVLLYGGRSGQGYRIIFSAWSGDTNAGVATSGVLLPSGRMSVKLPSLTADSSVTSLRLRIPGKRVKGVWDSGNAYELRPGADRGFVRTKCRPGSRLRFGADLLLGSRNSAGVPYGPTEQLSVSAASRC